MVSSPGTTKNLLAINTTTQQTQQMSTTTVQPPLLQYEDREIPPESNIPNTIFIDGQSNRRTHANQTNLYEQLSKFSFGEATPSTSHLSLSRDGSVSNGDFPGPLSDTTPRPSVSMPPPNNGYPQPSMDPSTDETASVHTFGASAHLPTLSSSTLNSEDHGSDELDSTASISNLGTFAQFSSDEYEEDSNDEFSEPDAPSQSTTYHPHGDSWDPLIRIPSSSSGGLYNQRRASLPIAIPGAMSSSSMSGFDTAVRSREDSIATVRRPSRSLDDDIQMLNARTSAVHAGPSRSSQSEHQMRGDWEALGNKGEGIEQSTPATGLVEASSAFQGLDQDWLREIQGGITSMDPSDAAAIVSPVQRGSGPGRRPSGQSWIGWFTGGRRQSSATIGTLEDPFSRQVNRWDNTYRQNRDEWSFRKEKADGPRGSYSADLRSVSTGDSERTIRPPRPTPNGMPRGMEEIWRCELVGRYKVSRREVTLKTNTSKPPQQRVVVQPFADPYSLADIPHAHGTPVTIHKHSRAIAFSIYRQRVNSHPSQRSRGVSRVGASRLSIMLAPKRVQEQYTSTRTTIALDTHGLLTRDNPHSARNERRLDESHNRSSYREDRDRKNKAGRTTPGIFKGDKKEKKSKSRSEQSTSSQSSSSGSVTGSVSVPSTSGLLASKSSSRDPSLYTQNLSSSSSLPSLQKHEPIVQPLYRTGGLIYVPPPHSAPFRQAIRGVDYDDDDSDDVPTKTKTPHSEAFSTMDPRDVAEQSRKWAEQSRKWQEQLRDMETTSPSRWKRLKQYLSTPAPSTSRELGFTPPWCLMTSRSQQEEVEGIMKSLNESFEGVGLLPSKPPTKNKTLRSRLSRNNARPDIFDCVAADNLYMLLPLWPGETDLQSFKADPSASQPYVPPEQRQYLLVYYVPFPNDGRSKRDNDRRNQVPQTPGIDEVVDEFAVLLTSFHCAGRVVSYNDLKGSGVLAPNDGLFITGPIAEAMEYLPSPSTRDESHSIFAICQSREQGVEFVPEAFSKMGLCYPNSKPSRMEPIPIPSETDLPEELEKRLTPIGRAVAEMAWLGCVALTSFGSV